MSEPSREQSEPDVGPAPVYGHVLDAVRRAGGGLYEQVRSLPVTPVRDRSGPDAPADPRRIRAHLAERFDFEAPRERADVVADVTDMLRRWSVHVTHPRYFGLFNPSPHPAAVGADALAAIFNPQLAVWDHAPAANEMEAHALAFLARRVGFDPDASHASFTSGGQEANHTAVIAALAHAFPELTRGGLRSLDADPVLYVSADGHHSIEKAASATGLGHGAVRRVDVDDDLRLDPSALARRIRRDRADGHAPFLVVATAGTTGPGVVDPLPEIAEVAREEGLWLHVDAAWAGSALLSRRLRDALAGIDAADSVTWDAHKWLWAPVGTGMFFCRRPDAVARPFALRTGYVPAGTPGTTDRLDTTLQWSRRFTGLRVFMTLAELGVRGVEELVERQAAMGDLLRERLAERGWEVVNRTRLPVVCFTHPGMEEAGGPDAEEIARRVCHSGDAWISSLALPGGRRVLRACVTSYRTGEDDVEALVAAVERALESTHEPDGAP